MKYFRRRFMTTFNRFFMLTSALILTSSILSAQGTKKPKPKEIAPAVQIYFDLNKSALKKAEKAKLDKLVEDLKSKEEYRIWLTGHTDSLGNDAYNMELSASRVDEVYDYLIGLGVDSVVLKKNYFGSSKPREGNSDEEKRAKNRRVEITIYEKEKEVKPPPPPPVVKDTCGRDTSVFIGKGVQVKMNICEYTARCQSNPMGCITVSRLNTVDEILNGEVPLATSKGEGFIWGGIFDFKMKGDSCLKKPASFTFTVDPESYKRARLMAQKAKNSNLEPDKGTRLTVNRTKTEMKITMPISCPGKVYCAANAGRSKTAKFKDKTGKIASIYVVSENPVTIIPATKTGKFWFVNYKDVPDAKLVLKLNDDEETLISDISLSKVRKTKKPGELRKKYKIKQKHF